MTIPAFYPVLDTEVLARRGIGVVTAAETLLDAGAKILQFRHKAFFSRAVFEEASRVAELCRAANALFVMNDRADFAMLLNAALHLGQEDLAPADARRILLTGSVIGFSTHNEQQLRAGDREPVDYLAIGPIFATGTKQDPDPVVGLDRLRAMRPLTQKPLVAIGGITRQTAPAVLAAGADSVAVIGDLYPDRAHVQEWLAICSSHT